MGWYYWFFGAFILAVDKGALCLVLSAFDTLPEAQFQEFVPFLSVIVNKAGLLWVVWLLPLLPLGAAIQALGLFKEKFISKWQTVCIITGLLLLNNPDIEFISATGALLNVCRIYSLGCKNPSGKNEMFLNSVPYIRHKKGQKI